MPESPDDLDEDSMCPANTEVAASSSARVLAVEPRLELGEKSGVEARAVNTLGTSEGGMGTKM